MEHAVDGRRLSLEGEVAGARRTFVIPPAEAYGESDPRLLKAVPLAALPVADPREGMRLATRDADGEVTPMTIVAIREGLALLDFNPRFAGRTSTTSTSKRMVRPATDEELTAGAAQDANG